MKFFVVIWFSLHTVANATFTSKLIYCLVGFVTNSYLDCYTGCFTSFKTLLFAIRNFQFIFAIIFLICFRMLLALYDIYNFH